jgi:small-conductance mechanosensitive channel
LRWTRAVSVVLIVLCVLFGGSARAATDAAVEAAALDAALEASSLDAEVDSGVVEDAAADVVEAVDATVAQAAPDASAPVVVVEGSPVRLRDKKVFSIRVPRAGVSAEERAKRASAALDRVASEESEDVDVRVEAQNGALVVVAGKIPIVELGPEDATAAGDASVEVTAASIVASVQSALKSEHTRSVVAKTVFSWSLVVLFAVAAVLTLRKARDVIQKGRNWVGKHPEKLPVLRVGAVEILRPAAFQGVIQVAISLLERALQLLVAYLWVVVSLSLFESTRDVGKRVTGFVLTPLGALVGRIATSLPLLVVAITAIAAVLLLVRFVGLFFGSVARGETQLSWLPQDLAAPTSVLVRAGMIIIAIILGAPLVTGSEEGASARASLALAAALALASVPVLATGVIGTVMIFGRRLRIGDFVSIEGRQGRIAHLTLFEVVLHDGEGAEVRVPHVTFVLKPFRVLGPTPLSVVEVFIDPGVSPDKVREVLADAASGVHGEPRVRLLGLDADGARWEIVGRRGEGEGDIASRIAKALAEAGIALGRSGRR